MKTNSTLRSVLLIAAGLALVSGGYFAGLHRSGSEVASPAAAAAGTDKIDPKTGRKVLYWHDPMVPGQKFDKPGKSPFMDMQLVPVYADAGEDGDGVKISPVLRQDLGIRYATVRREEVRDSLELVGTTQFDESDAQVIQSRVAGYIDRLFARAPMQRIKRGAPVASLFVPDWIAPQEEYLALKRSGNRELAEAARQRMRALSIPDALVSQAERTGQARSHLTLVAPASGIVTELSVREGAMVTPGMTLAKVAGLRKVWLIAEIPETLSASARPGMAVEAAFAGAPGRKYSGHVREIIPGVNAATRTVQARLELDNRDGSLTPGMLMRVRLQARKADPRLLVPSEAIITSGKHSVVLVSGDNNSIQPVAVTTGRDIGEETEIVSGLNEGQKVVASGQFLVDSEARLKSVLPKFENSATDQGSSTATQPSANAAPLYHGIGKVEKVSAENITFSHRPIPELKWPAMTMGFAKPRPDAFTGIKAGQDAAFSFRESKDGYTLESVTAVNGDKK